MLLSSKSWATGVRAQACRSPVCSSAFVGQLRCGLSCVTAASSGSMGAEPLPGRSLAASWQAKRAGLAQPIAAAAKDVSAEQPNQASEYVQLWAGLGLLYVCDWYMKKVFTSLSIKFPASLLGMFAITVILMAVGEGNAAKIRGFFAPALNWIAKWLPIFYVPALVTLPLALQGLAGDELAKMMGILSVGMLISLTFTAQITIVIRNMVNTPTKEVVKSKAASPFLASHYLAWGAVAAASLAGIATNAGGMSASLTLPFMLAITILGYLFGNAVPSNFQSLLHPVLSTALAGNLGCAIYGMVTGGGYDLAQKIYLAKGAGAMGAGDLLMSFLGSVILSMGFRIYDQRETMARHAPEILGATLTSATFSFFSTALLAKALGLQAALARALIPRCVTVALALPIASQLDAPLALAAASVLLNCLLCANFGIGIMNALGCKDTIARGLAMAGVGGGFGTAALTSKEPEALPFCALGYSMVGIFSTFLATLPQVREMLIGIVG